MEKPNYFPHNITPTGWLKEYLDRDLNGITGHLDEYCKENMMLGNFNSVDMTKFKKYCFAPRPT